jgi:hypothetical protein
MDRDILKYLYQFYEKGDYFTYHSLIPVFSKIRTPDQNSLMLRLRTMIGYLSGMTPLSLIETEDTAYSQWGAKDANGLLYNYDNTPLKARITKEGFEYIERYVDNDKKDAVDHSILITNRLTMANIGVSILLTIIVVVLQIKADRREDRKEAKEAIRSEQETIQHLRQLKNDSLLYKLALRIPLYYPDTLKKK